MTGRGASAETTARGPGRAAMRRETVRKSDALQAAGHARADSAFATLAEAAAVFGKSAGNFGKYVTTARNYPQSRRRIDPAISDRREVTRLSEAEPAAVFGKSAGNSGKYVTTSRGYSPLRCRNSLTFFHHLEVARLPEAEAERILDTALDESWSRDRTRAAAREASAEGKAARLRRDNAQLKRALRQARADARDVADHARDRLDGERRVIRDSLRRIVKIASELASADALEGLHGNARRAVGRDLRKLGDMLADNLEGALDELGAAAAIVDGHRE